MRDHRIILQKVGSGVCAAKSRDGPNPYFAHNIHYGDSENKKMQKTIVLYVHIHYLTSIGYSHNMAILLQNIQRSRKNIFLNEQRSRDAAAKKS